MSADVQATFFTGCPEQALEMLEDLPWVALHVWCTPVAYGPFFRDGLTGIVAGTQGKVRFPLAKVSSVVIVPGHQSAINFTDLDVQPQD